MMYRGRAAEALPLLKTRLRVTPKSMPLQTRIGIAYHLMGDSTKALTYLEPAYKKNGKFILATYYRGLALEAKGQSEEALSGYRIALEDQKDPAHRLEDNGEWMLVASRIAGKCGDKENEQLFRETAEKSGFTFLPEDKPQVESPAAK